MEPLVFLVLLLVMDVAALRWGADSRTFERDWR
jgi:hypothetical protein